MNDVLKKRFFYKKGEVIDDSLTVKFPIEVLDNGDQYYRVVDAQGQLKRIKLFLSVDNPEIRLRPMLRHPNLERLISQGKTTYQGKDYVYFLYDFLSGEKLSTQLERVCFDVFEAITLTMSVLNVLRYLHGKGVAHQAVVAEHIFLKMTAHAQFPVLTNFSHSVDNASVQAIQKDIAQVGELLYFLIKGEPYEGGNIAFDADLPDEVLDLISRAMSLEGYAPFETVDQLIDAIHDRILLNKEDRSHDLPHKKEDSRTQVEPRRKEHTIPQADLHPKEECEPEDVTDESEEESRKGFKGIAGMQDLKAVLQHDVIDALREKEKYKKYKLTIPNGMLLYGPPGCGKTYFATKLAEEIGFKFYKIAPSDLQSKWVNASQENVKKLFATARKNKPAVIFIDEIDAVAPVRSENVTHMNLAVVNELLVQMSDCGKSDVFVIAATNRPDSVDTALLRTGRLDKHFYLPPPDEEARKWLFEFYLAHRPIEQGMQYRLLAQQTEGYVSSDIEFLCDEAARTALRTDSLITTDMVIDVIKQTKPSLSEAQRKAYEDIRLQFS